MAEQIIDGRGAGTTMVVNPDGSINVSGLDISIGSLALSLENIYIQSGANIDLGSAWTNIGSVIVSNPAVVGSIGIQTISGTVTVDNRVAGSIVNLPIGSFYQLEITPTLVSSNPLIKLEYIISGTSSGVTGSEIGSIIKFLTGTGSYVQVISWSNDNITQIGSWV